MPRGSPEPAGCWVGLRGRATIGRNRTFGTGAEFPAFPDSQFEAPPYIRKVYDPAMAQQSTSPNGRHEVKRRWGGELGMSGPRWDYISVDGGAEFRCLSSDVVWSDDSEFVAFVEWHVDDVSNRKGAEGMTSRVVVHRLSDGKHRSFLGNAGLACVELLGILEGNLSLLVNGERRQIQIARANL